MAAPMLPRRRARRLEAPGRLPAARVPGRRRRARVRSRPGGDGHHGNVRVPAQSRGGGRRSPSAAGARRRAAGPAARRSSTDARCPADRIDVRSSTLTLQSAPDAGTLTIRSTIAPARNVALEGLYVSSGVFCTQCEPEGFRRITYFPDRPDVLARYRVTLRADRARYPQLLSNGNLVASGTLPGRTPFRDVARPVSEADVPVRAGRGRSRRARRHVRHRIGPHGGAADLFDSGQPAALPARDGVAQARRCAGTRSGSAANTTSTRS